MTRDPFLDEPQPGRGCAVALIVGAPPVTVLLLAWVFDTATAFKIAAAYLVVACVYAVAEAIVIERRRRRSAFESVDEFRRIRDALATRPPEAVFAHPSDVDRLLDVAGAGPDGSINPLLGVPIYRSELVRPGEVLLVSPHRAQGEDLAFDAIRIDGGEP